jgi:hypothetical protein
MDRMVYQGIKDRVMSVMLHIVHDTILSGEKECHINIDPYPGTFYIKMEYKDEQDANV